MELTSSALLAPFPGLSVTLFDEADLAELVVLQRCCWVQEALINDTLDVPALRETAVAVLSWAREWTTVIVRQGPRLIAAARGRSEGTEWHVGRLMVAPDLASRGVGTWLLGCIEQLAPDKIERFVLFTGGRSRRNVRTYERAGYQLCTSHDGIPSGHISGAVRMTKLR